jgi:RimJ/RimL family protein N-acetyltransferase
MPSSHTLDLDLRAATFDDVERIADLEATRDPEDPRDPDVLRSWWTKSSMSGVAMRSVGMRDGGAVAFLSARHERWSPDAARRFGWIRAVIHHDLWSEPGYEHLVTKGEDWLRSEKADVAAITVGEQFTSELEVLARLGYREMRRQRDSELDLIGQRDQLLAEAMRQRRKMQDQGVKLLPLSEDADPDRMTKLHEMMVAAEQDIPTTVPTREMPFDEWKRATFENPGIRADHFWIAREGDAIVGLSVLTFPPRRGLPWTDFTATSRAVRGRGIARALKYETMVQAIDLGFTRVRTSNDGDNAPMLHINLEMGYQLIRPVIELHRDLAR